MKCADGYDVVRKTQIALFKESGIDTHDFNGLIDLFSPEKMAETDFFYSFVMPQKSYELGNRVFY